MARNFNFSVDWDGLDAFIDEIDGMEKDIDREIIREMNLFKGKPEEGAKSLTPVLTNELTRSISTTAVTNQMGMIGFALGTNLHYARRMHEHRGGWGKATQEKQRTTWRGYTPGSKYVENAVRGTEDDFEQAMANALDRVIGRR